MREGCRHFAARTYKTGDTVRKCQLDLAPEAPWRCPDDCPKFEPKQGGLAWSPGTLVSSEPPPEPPGVGEGDSVARLLDEAEDIVNAAVPEALAEFEATQEASRGGFFSRLFRRKPRG